MKQLRNCYESVKNSYIGRKLCIKRDLLSCMVIQIFNNTINFSLSVSTSFSFPSSPSLIFFSSLLCSSIQFPSLCWVERHMRTILDTCVLPSSSFMLYKYPPFTLSLFSIHSYFNHFFEILWPKIKPRNKHILFAGNKSIF